ncbi:uncharacterized protein ACB058_019478 [Synchiropus picturatus]
MWLWRHNKLCRQPAVPLKRKRRYCRLKEKHVSFHQSAEESSSDITNLFPHLNMEPLSSSERSFVVNHHIFLVRNWEVVRNRQMRLKMGRMRERDTEEEGRSSPHPSSDEANEEESHIKSDQPVGVEMAVYSGDLHHQSQHTSNSLTASSRQTKTPRRREERGGKPREDDSREERGKRLDDLLLTLRHL